MSEINWKQIFKRDIVFRMNAYEVIDLMRQLDMHKDCLKAELKQYYKAQKEANWPFVYEAETDTAEEDIKFIRKTNGRLLRTYRRWQNRPAKKAVEIPEEDDLPF